MKHRRDEFNIYVWGSPIAEDLMRSGWDMTESISRESSQYLQSLGYKCRINIPPPQFGAAGGFLWGILESIPKIIPFIRIFIFLIKILADKYARMPITQSSQTRTHMTIDLNYESEEAQWIEQWDPIGSADKLGSMLDAGYFLSQHLQKKYPDIIFGLSINFSFKKGDARRTYTLQPSNDTRFNIARFKKTLRQTSFEKHIHKTFTISRGLFVKRTDYYLVNYLSSGTRNYYFVLPSPLISELWYKYKHLKFKIKSRESI